MSSISLKLRKNKTDGYSIYLHFNYGRKKQLRYSTGFNISTSNNWDEKKQKVKNVSSEPRSAFINSEVSKLVSFSENLLDRYARKTHPYNTPLSNPVIKKELDAFYKDKTPVKKKKKSLLEFYKWFIDYYEKNPLPKTQKPLSPNTVRPYRTSLEKLKAFAKENYPIDFDDITLEFYDDFLYYLRKSSYSNNYIGNQIKLLKAIMNYAFERELHNNLDYKKKGFAKLTENVNSIYLTEEEIKILHELQIENKRKARARDLFLIGCYTGLRVSDFNNLNKNNIKKSKRGFSYIETVSKKTGKIVLIPIKKETQDILNRYNGAPPKSMPDQHINLFLKEIGEEAGLDTIVYIEKTLGGNKVKTKYLKYELLTNHTARRSFCTNAYLAGLPSLDIMAISGHKSEAVFLNYIKITPTERLERIAEHSFFK